jgi:hypothetical protein
MQESSTEVAKAFLTALQRHYGIQTQVDKKFTKLLPKIKACIRTSELTAEMYFDVLAEWLNSKGSQLYASHCASFKMANLAKDLAEKRRKMHAGATPLTTSESDRLKNKLAKSHAVIVGALDQGYTFDQAVWMFVSELDPVYLAFTPLPVQQYPLSVEMFQQVSAIRTSPGSVPSDVRNLAHQLLACAHELSNRRANGTDLPGSSPSGQQLRSPVRNGH